MEESAGVSSSAASPPKVDDLSQPPTLLQPAVTLPNALTNGSSFENSVSSPTPRSPALTPTQQRLVSSFESDHNYQTPASRVVRPKTQSPQHAAAFEHSASNQPKVAPQKTRTLADLRKQTRAKTELATRAAQNRDSSAAVPSSSESQLSLRMHSQLNLPNAQLLSSSTFAPHALSITSHASDSARTEAPLQAARSVCILNKSEGFSRTTTPVVTVRSAQPNVSIVTPTSNSSPGPSNQATQPTQYIIIPKNGQPAGAASSSPSSSAHQPERKDSEAKLDRKIPASQCSESEARSKTETCEKSESNSEDASLDANASSSKSEELSDSSTSSESSVVSAGHTEEKSNPKSSTIKLVLIRKGDSNYTVRKPQSEKDCARNSKKVEVAKTEPSQGASKDEGCPTKETPVERTKAVENPKCEPTPVDVYDFDSSSNDVAAVTLTPSKHKQTFSRSHPSLQKLLTSDNTLQRSPKSVQRSSAASSSSSIVSAVPPSPSGKTSLSNSNSGSATPVPASSAAAVSLSSPEKTQLPSSPCGGSVLQTQNNNKRGEEVSLALDQVLNQARLAHLQDSCFGMCDRLALIPCNKCGTLCHRNCINMYNVCMNCCSSGPQKATA